MPKPKHLAAFRMTVAVFVLSSTSRDLLDLMLVHLEEDIDERTAADAVARGGLYAGHCGVHDGQSTVHIEPGFEAAMVYAGAAFAAMLGPLLKQHQLEQASLGRDRTAS